MTTAVTAWEKSLSKSQKYMSTSELSMTKLMAKLSLGNISCIFTDFFDLRTDVFSLYQNFYAFCIFNHSPRPVDVLTTSLISSVSNSLKFLVQFDWFKAKKINSAIIYTLRLRMIKKKGSRFIRGTSLVFAIRMDASFFNDIRGRGFTPFILLTVCTFGIYS